ncbi:MAG: alpha/beta hydrolase fold domain-containing protein [Candidatus Hydrogenedentes bacterium]|nr:alpha/beta hydrolase fold domain-containing protein [Candidatus Hydrogenedentota bacterium]
MKRGRPILVTWMLSIALFNATAQPPAPMTDTKPPPDLRNESYGPHERNVFDLWKAPSEKPTPVVVFFHGGGFLGGDKWTLDPSLLSECIRAGISEASSNYRLSSTVPFPAPMLDGARVIQFLRFRAIDLNLDPKRIAVSGNSAGAGISLWIGFHDDLADPNSPDPVLRESSRVSCAGVIGAQCSYDPRFIREVIGGRAYEHPALPVFYGLKLEELDSPRAYKLYEEAAPITYVNAGDPPVFLYYSEPKAPLAPGPNKGPTLYYPEFGKPVEGYTRPGWGIHHPKFGEVLKARLDPLGIECVLRHKDDYIGKARPEDAAIQEMVQFYVRRFRE